ncbi:hypothetical protein ASC75_02420 [Aminobacter sp. DSM 101952]|uniref:hypothetical protein n=1 Tax=Aminobacter sp. DSM 101952 TaxID=2735891 RepID=UPI0006FD3C57|nr:hypothetical protein [Aminobacter sp. DSM 101952]KQU76489.1 hypothetical protein ASC75_02420 [Aminobacter sp. DSM 101952]
MRQTYFRQSAVKVSPSSTCGEAWNETGFANDDFDAKLNEALSISEVDKRRAAMQHMEQILQESGVIIQPYWRKVFTHFVPKVKDHHAHPLLQIQLEKVWLES